jgi:hypothetical protein
MLRVEAAVRSPPLAGSSNVLLQEISFAYTPT